ADFEVRLPYFSFSEDWVVITDYLTDGIDMGAQRASTTMKPVPIGALPGQSEPDVLQTIQFLPGVSSPDGGAANLHIRGGTPDHNLILWEDIPVYQNAHLFGMVSAFNPYILEKVDVYRGGFGAEHGGRISGLVDLRSPDETLEDSHWGVGLNSTHAYAYGNLAFGPKQNFGLVFSGRTALTNLWRSPIQEQSTFRSQLAPLFDVVDWEDIPRGIGLNDAYDFSDANLKFSWAVHPNHQISIAGFASRSDFTNTIIDDMRPIQQEEVQQERNYGVKAGWKAKWGERWQSDTYVLTSDYDYSYDILLRPQDGVEMGPLNEGERKNSLSEWQVKSAFSFAGPWGQTLEGGYQFTHYEVDFFVLSYRRGADSVMTRDTEVVGNHGVFLTLKGDPEKKLGYELGVRANSQTQGSNIFWEPRLRLWYQPNDQWTFQVHSGRYFQFISQVEQFVGEEFGMLTPMWRLNGGKSDPILQSWQHQLGFIFSKNGWVVDVQAYLKRSKGMSLLSLADIQPLGKKFFAGDAKTEGIDLLLKKRIKTYRTWVSYSLGKTEFFFPNFFDRSFAAPYDIRHQVNWVHLWQAGAWEFSAGWKYQTGLPFSEPEELTQNPQGLFVLRYEEINGIRLPAQHQLDLSVVYQFHPSARQNWQGWVGISFLNIYNRRNIYYRGYYHYGRMGEMRQIGSLEKSQLGFTPNAVLRFQF
ncbi:MAG: TonB-dependent receptor plug domain-containing protein, partial [Bacteroidota bacterium]